MPLDGAAVEKQRWIFRPWTKATTSTGRLRPPSVVNHPLQPYHHQPDPQTLRDNTTPKNQWSVSLRHQERQTSGNTPQWPTQRHGRKRSGKVHKKTETATKVTKEQGGGGLQKNQAQTQSQSTRASEVYLDTFAATHLSFPPCLRQQYAQRVCWRALV